MRPSAGVDLHLAPGAVRSLAIAAADEDRLARGSAVCDALYSYCTKVSDASQGRVTG